jgi:DNA-binding transcriptional regulator PaaX
MIKTIYKGIVTKKTRETIDEENNHIIDYNDKRWDEKWALVEEQKIEFDSFFKVFEKEISEDSVEMLRNNLFGEE